MIDFNDLLVFFVIVWQVLCKFWQLWSGGFELVFFCFQDGGDIWNDIMVSFGFFEGFLGKMIVVVLLVSLKCVWVNIEVCEGGFYCFDDGGVLWCYVNGVCKFWQCFFYFMQVCFDLVDVDMVYVLSFVLEKFVNGGENFFLMCMCYVDIYDFWIDLMNLWCMIVGDDGGGSVLVNGGVMWIEQDYLMVQMYCVVMMNDFLYYVCGMQQDNWGVCVLS